MKQIFLTITLFSILAILPLGIFAQRSVPQGNAETLWNQMFEQLDKRQFPQLIETATNYLRFQVTERQKIIALDLRSLALKSIYSKKGNSVNSLPSELNGTFKFSDDSAEKLRRSVADSTEVINYFTKNAPLNDADKQVFALSQNQTGKVFLDLAIFYSHNHEDFAQAEKYLRDSLGKIPDEQFDQKMGILKSLAGQYRFNEVRELGKKLLAESPENRLLPILTNTTFAFVMMGEYNHANAFLLETAGILKASNKSLKPLAEANEYLQQNQLAVIPNPQTAMELNRQGGLYYLKGEFDKAIPLIEKSLNLLGSPTALRWWVMSQADKNIYAKQDNDNLLKADPTDIAGLSLRGMGFVGENQMDKAAADFSNAIEIYPELAFFYNTFENLKEIYRLQNKSQLSSETDAKQQRLKDLIAGIQKSKTANSSETPKYTDSPDFLDGKPSSTPKPTPTPTPKPVEANPAIKSGSLADCKQILSDACRNFLLYSNIADVAPALGLIKQSAEKYSKSGFTLYVEPTSGGIISVRIFKDSGWQPSNNLKFGEKMSKVKEKYPNGEYENGRYYDDYLVFPNYTLGFEKGKLWVVELKRDRTDLEETAKRTRDAEIRRQEADAEANKTPEQRAKEIIAIYQSFHDRIEAKVKRHNDLAAELKDPVVNAFPSMFYARKNEMSKIRIEIPKMIDDFLTKYKGQLPQAMIKHLNEDKAKLSWQSNR